VHSLCSDYVGVMNEATGVIVSPESAFFDDGHGILVGRTYAMSDVQLQIVLDDALQASCVVCAPSPRARC
jgi:hypothetical protein